MSEANIFIDGPWELRHRLATALVRGGGGRERVEEIPALDVKAIQPLDGGDATRK